MQSMFTHGIPTVLWIQASKPKFSKIKSLDLFRMTVLEIIFILLLYTFQPYISVSTQSKTLLLEIPQNFPDECEQYKEQK